MIRLPFLLALLSVGVTGCAPKEYVPVPPPPVKRSEATEFTNLMPLKSGTVWTYIVDTETVAAGRPPDSVSSELLFAVNKVESTPNGTRAMIEVYRDDKLVDSQAWLTTPKGIYQESVGLKHDKFDPPVLVVPVPAVATKEFTYKGKGVSPVGTVGPMEVHSEILPPQVVDTALGSSLEESRVEAVGVAAESVFQLPTGPGLSKTVTFFQPDVGLVRLVQTILTNNARVKTTLRLKDMKVIGQ